MNPIAEAECPAAPIAPPALRVRREPAYPFLRRDLRLILGEGAAHSIMVGIGESYLPAFVLAMGMGQVAAGLVTTIPLLAGAALQLVSPMAVRALGSHRRWVVICATVQAASFLPLCAAALLGRLPVWAMFACAAVYWGSGLGTSPSWSTWIDTLVPARIRAPYFSRRTRTNQIATLGGFVVGGFSLQAAKAADWRLQAFALMFLIAAVCRFASMAMLARHSELHPLSNGHRHVSMREFLSRFRCAQDGRLLVYLLSVQAAAQVAGPYFTPFMLGPMGLSYVSYVTLIAISFAAKALALPALGSFAARFGTRKLLWLGGVGIVPIAALWLISRSFAFLVVVQVLAGFTWAAYELAMFLLFFESIRPAERTSMLTNFNFANSVATAVGSLLGGALLLALGKTYTTYLLLFGLSSLARAVTIVALARVRGATVADAPPEAASKVVVRPIPSRAA